MVFFLWLQLGQLNTAILFFSKSLAFNPEHIEANTSLGGIYKDSGDLSKAERFFTRAFEARNTQTYACRAILELPIIYQNNDEMKISRDRYLTNLLN